MNLRILKKLSKRAAPYMEKIGCNDPIFLAEPGENYHGMLIRDMTRLDRCSSCHTDVISKETHVATIAPKARAGTKYPYVKLSLPSHPLKGTPMVGAMVGYFEPEWDEQTTWEVLSEWVRGQFFDVDLETGQPFSHRQFHHPGEIFRTADELLAQGI